jgi:hypothetical protein
VILLIAAVAVITAPELAQSDEAPPRAAKPKIELGLRLHARYEWQEEPAKHELDLVRSRLLLEMMPTPWLSGQLDVELSAAPAVRDAFVDVAATPVAHLVVGQFKKPFSRIELTAAGKLPLTTRGLVNERLIEDFAYGGRDVGLMVHGEAGPAWYAVGTFNGTQGAPEVDTAKDFAARVELDLGKAADVGASGSIVQRNPDIDGYEAWFRRAAEVDGHFRMGPVDGVVEVIWAEEPIPQSQRDQFGATAYALLRTPRFNDVSARPIAKVELLDDDVRLPNDHAWAGMLGVNFDFRAPLRVLVQYQEIWPTDRSSIERERRVHVQLALDMKTALATE